MLHIDLFGWQLVVSDSFFSHHPTGLLQIETIYNHTLFQEFYYSSANGKNNQALVLEQNMPNAITTSKSTPLTTTQWTATCVALINITTDSHSDAVSLNLQSH